MNYPHSDAKTRRIYKQAWWIDFRWPLIGGFVLFIFILGYIGFRKYFAVIGESRSDLDIIYLTLQLFTLESGSVKGPIGWELELARWLSPVVAAYTVVNALGFIFREQFQLLRLKLIKDHVIIYGSEQKTHLLAKRFLDNGYKVVLVEHDERGFSNNKKQIHSFIEISGDARDKKLLYRIRTHKAKYLILFCENDGINIEIAVNARNLIREYSGGPLTCIVHIVDPQLCHLLKEKEIGTEKTDAFRLEFFDIFDSGARYLLKEYPPFMITKGFEEYFPHLLIVGFGQMGESLLLHASKKWKESYLPSYKKLRVTIIDKVAEQKKETLDLQYPQLQKICDITALQINIESPEFKRAKFLFENTPNSDITNIFICLDDDSFGLTAALALQNQMKVRKIPIVIRMETDGGLATLLGEKSEQEEFAHLKVFGLLDRTCEPELLLGGVNETLARAAHQEYVEIQLEAGETSIANPSIVPWEELNEETKESNRLQADHIITKMKTIGCMIAPLMDWDAELFNFTAQEIELMAEMEHVRWMSERLQAGWTYAEGEKNIIKKTSPYLVNWTELSEEIKNIDRDIVKRIPKLLAKVDLQVYRK